MRKNFLLTAIVLLLPCALAHAQGGYVGPRAYDPNAPKHTVSGSVVNSATGELIPRALVQLMGPLQRSDLTDSQGGFRFEGVPEGRAMFMARRPGFFSSEELSRGGGRPRAPMMITGDVSSLVLKLTPEGIVAASITGDDGEPLEGVQVRLKRQIVIPGSVGAAVVRASRATAWHQLLRLWRPQSGGGRRSNQQGARRRLSADVVS
jgi:hypothetical protein